MRRRRKLEKRFPARIRPALKPKQVRSLHEEVPSVIEQPSAFSVPQLSVNVRPQRQQHILQIAVVADVDRRAWVDEISDQEIGVEVLNGL